MFSVLQSMFLNIFKFPFFTHHLHIASHSQLYEMVHVLHHFAYLGQRLHVKRVPPSLSPAVTTNYALVTPYGTTSL